MNTWDIFIENMKQYRKFFGISQEKLANLSGLDVSYVGRIERKVVCPTLSTINKIAKAFKVDTSLMFVKDSVMCLDDYALLVNKKGNLSIEPINCNDVDEHIKKILDSLIR